jgi:endonuclease/exonuclease/phosphatase family metal-dependent hydrolase
VPVLTVASYNIHKAVGSDGRCDPARILDVIDEIGADVALLQEADTRLGIRSSVLPPALLAARGWQAAPLSLQPAAMGWHGNAVLVRGAARLAHAWPVTLPALEPRGAVIADIAHGSHTLRLVGAHLDLTGLLRARQARTVVAAAARAPGALPELVMGDFNEWRRLGALAPLARHWRELVLGPSFPARLPIGRLDRAFAHPALGHLAAGVHASALARQASDHLPIWVRLSG